MPATLFPTAAGGFPGRLSAGQVWLSLATVVLCHSLAAAGVEVPVESPDGRNVIELQAAETGLSFAVTRDEKLLVGPSPLGPELAGIGRLDAGVRIVDTRRGTISQTFTLPWGKTTTVLHRGAYAVVTLTNQRNLEWQVELRAYDDGVAFRYRLPRQEGLLEFALQGETTRFDAAGQPEALFNLLPSFTTSHESLYHREPLSAIPASQLMDCPLLLVWQNGTAAAITEARVRNFAGMYLERGSAEETGLRCRLSPLPSRPDVCVAGQTPLESPWRVVLLAGAAGQLLESNLLLCLNDPPTGDFSWARPGKSTFHWWYGEFEDDYKLPSERATYVARHRKYIDFCAQNDIAYHAVSGDGLAWYQQSPIDYGTAAEDADLCQPRPEIGLPDILAYARQRGVGIRLWVHWRPLSRQLEEAMTTYEAWGVKGLMVDFLDRDDQQMIEFTERMLQCAARHKIHIQIHGSSKYSGEQRTFPHLFNREGVLNLEYVKWSKLCTPAHAVNVAYTRALAGPVDFHLGGFRPVPRTEFQPRDRAPVVMGTRCHHLALYVVYENPMPMVADAPSAYQGQAGFEFLREVPTTWDETRFVAGEPGEYLLIARRDGDTWYLGGITNWTARQLDVPLSFLGADRYQANCWVDGSQDESQPEQIRRQARVVDRGSGCPVEMAPGGGFVAVLRPLDPLP